MSGLEVVAVVGAVAGVISAYKDASRIVADFKDKRRAKKAEQLERSLLRAPLAIEEARSHGVERFGQPFALGDQIAREALKDVLIALQGSLLKQLVPAAHSGEVVDFSMLVDISDISRIKSVGALWELHMRMAATAPLGLSSFTLPSPPTPPPEIGATKPLTATSKSAPSERQSDEEDPRLERRGTVETVSTTTTMKFPNRSRWPFRRGSSQPTTASEPSDFRTLSHPTSPKRPFSPPGNIKIRNVQTSASSRSSSVLLAPTNDYGGFCKGAYYLQAGLFADGVKIRNMSTAKTGESWYWGCRNTKCVFESPALKIRKEFFFDDSVREFEGLKYRWAFLAKSHVAIERTKDRIYNYRCIFCLLQGKEAPVVARIRPFLEHVAQHRGERMGETIPSKTICINDRVAADEDYFDINLLPLETASEYIDEHAEPSNPLAPEQEQADNATSVEGARSGGGLSIHTAWSQSGDNVFDLWKDPWKDP